MAERNKRYADFLKSNLVSGLAGYKSYHELKKFESDSWTYIEVLKEGSTQHNFSLCDDLLVNILWIDEVFDQMFTYSLLLDRTDLCQYWYKKAPHLVLDYLKKDKMASSFLNQCWVVCITYGVDDKLHKRFYNKIRDSRMLFTEYNSEGFTCLHCKTQDRVIRLECGHCFCFGSLLEERVRRNCKIDYLCHDFCRKCKKEQFVHGERVKEHLSLFQYSSYIK